MLSLLSTLLVRHSFKTGCSLDCDIILRAHDYLRYHVYVCPNHSARLQSLALGGNELTDDSIMLIADALMSNLALMRLYLGDNRIGVRPAPASCNHTIFLKYNNIIIMYIQVRRFSYAMAQVRLLVWRI